MTPYPDVQTGLSNGELLRPLAPLNRRETDAAAVEYDPVALARLGGATTRLGGGGAAARGIGFGFDTAAPALIRRGQPAAVGPGVRRAPAEPAPAPGVAVERGKATGGF